MSAVVSTKYHDASSYVGSACWISSVRVDGRIVDTAEHNSEADAVEWCRREERRRGNDGKSARAEEVSNFT